MRIIKRRGPFRTIDVFLEDVSFDEVRKLQKEYQCVSILTHAPLSGMEGFRLRQKKTPNIYLSDGPEAVLSRFRDTVRNEVHRTERIDGFEVRVPDPDRDAPYRVYRDFEFSQGRAPISKEEFSRFICAGAYLDGRFISGITFFQSNDKIRIRSIFSLRMDAKGSEDKELYKTVGFASKRLMFDICRYGIEHGAKVVDLASINLVDPEKEPIARFKSGFGALIEDEYQYIWIAPVFRSFSWFAGITSRARVLLRL